MTRAERSFNNSATKQSRRCRLVFLFMRKVRSSWVRLAIRMRSFRVRMIAVLFQDGIRIATDAQFGREVFLISTDGGSIVIEEGVAIGRNTKLVAQGGCIHIERDAFVGDGVVITSMQKVRIGAGSQIAEYVVIRDQDHRIGTGPVRTSGFACAPIQIGRDCWIGAKATVLRGSSIGEGSVIGAHSLVRGDIPARCVAVGAPARVLRQIDGPAVAEPPAARKIAQP
jgi:acetyltransferase-like isoleucine patch superfamily enzyme